MNCFCVDLVFLWFFYSLQLQNGFGDEDSCIGFEEENEDEAEMESFANNDFGANSIVTRRSSFDFDENINDIVTPEFVQESFSDHIELAPPKSPAQPNLPLPEPNVGGRRSENPLSLLAEGTPLKPPAVIALQGGKKRYSSVFKDDEKIIPCDKIQKRLSK